MLPLTVTSVAPTLMRVGSEAQTPPERIGQRLVSEDAHGTRRESCGPAKGVADGPRRIGEEGHPTPMTVP